MDRFLLEYDTDRAGGFEPLRFVPGNKMVVLGLISSKEPALVSVMFANNETGVLQPLAEVVRLARQVGALVHCERLPTLT